MKKAALISAGWQLLFAAGAAVLAFGLWLAWKPLGFIVGGLIVALTGFGGWFESRKAGRR